jgi:hypothetical protein
MQRLLAGVACCLFGFASAAAAGGGTEFPKGTFTVRTTEGAMWALTLHDKGKFTLAREGRQAVAGTYSVDHDVVEFSDEKGPAAGTGTQQAGSYKWKLDGKKLTFKKVKDANRGREMILTADPLELKE